MKYTERRILLACLAMVCTAVLSGCKKDEPEIMVNPIADIDLMQGTWKGAEVGRDGEWTLVITDDQITADGPGQEDYVGTLTLNETMTPKTAVLTINECAFDQYVGTQANNLYKLEGSKLTIAGAEPGTGTIPSSFEPGSGTRVFELMKADIQP